MRVVILGGGVVGVTTAWYLARDGHEVVVLDRQGSPGRETSFANAGFIAPGHCFAWASPRAPLTLLRSLYSDDAALRLRPRADPRLLAWGLRFLANCTARRFRTNTLAKLRLCLYSLDCLKALREETGIDYEAATRGALYLYRSDRLLESAHAESRLARDEGLDIRVVDRDGAVAIEPALAAARDRFAGALFSAGDESGDCHLFTERLMALAAEAGATFLGDVEVRGLRAEGDRVVAAITTAGDFTADAFVLALGSYSPAVTRSVGVRLPVYPVKGYSMTVPVADPARAPATPVLDEHHLVAFSRFGNRFRLTASAEFAGYDTRRDPARFAPLRRIAEEMFPGAADFSDPDYWACLRPMTPDGPPILGRARHGNLWYNTGHGHMGWSMACGASRIVADLVAGRVPAHDATAMKPGRFRFTT